MSMDPPDREFSMALIMAGLTILLKERGGSLSITQAEFDAVNPGTFNFLEGDGAVTISLDKEKLDG